MFRNPIHLTGIPRHCWLWATSSACDTFIPNPHFNPDTAVKTSVYCVHGTADRSASFSLITDRMKEKLPDNIDGFHMVTFDGRMHGKSVQDFSSQLKDKIKANHSDDVIIIGHSRGALVASYFAEYLASENDVNIELVVSLCGPFRGSPVAMWPLTYFSTSVDEMRLDSQLLQELSDKIHQSDVRYLFVGAEKDQLVKSDSHLPYICERHGLNAVLLDRHGHLSIMSSHRLVDILNDMFAEVMTKDQAQRFNP